MKNFTTLETAVIELPEAVTGKLVYFDDAACARLGVRYTNDSALVILEIDNITAMPEFERFDTEHRATFALIPAGASFALKGKGYGWWEIL